MSDLLSDLPRPPHVPSWRDRMAEWAESLDLTPTRLVAGVVALAIIGLAGWKLLGPGPTAPELRLPFASTTTAAGDAAPTTGAPSGSTAAGAGTEVVVHVVGAVAAPGVHHLPAGSRVVDAVDAAGGATPDADLSRLNLAGLLQDGQQVYVPRVGEEPPPPIGAGTGAPSGGSPGTGPGIGVGAGPTTPVNINSATLDELDALPGIGPSIAQAIVAYRDEHGRFGSVDELLDVRGIGEAKLEQLRPLVTV